LLIFENSIINHDFTSLADQADRDWKMLYRSSLDTNDLEYQSDVYKIRTTEVFMSHFFVK